MSTQSIPTFSVIIPTYNREGFLKKALDSVLKQTFKDFELIVIDDGSTDRTKELIGLFKDERLLYYYQDNHGVAHARNRGLEKAKGEYIAFLDSDDWWKENKLERFNEAIQRNPQIKIFHSQELWYRSGQIHNPKKTHKKPNGWVYPQALSLCCISISTAVIHESVLKKVGNFDESFEACEDYDFWLRSTLHYPIFLIDAFLTEKEGGRPDQVSMNTWGLDRFRIRSLEKMLKSKDLSPENYDLTYRELKRKCAIFIEGTKKRGRMDEAQLLEELVQRYSTVLP